MRPEVDGDILNVTTRRPTVEPVLFADAKLATLMQDVAFDVVLKNMRQCALLCITLMNISYILAISWNSVHFRVIMQPLKIPSLKSKIGVYSF